MQLTKAMESLRGERLELLTYTCTRQKLYKIFYRSLILGLTSTFILFSPASNIFFKVGFVVAERVLYLPSMGYFLIIIVGLRKLATFEGMKKVMDVCFKITMCFK